MLKETFATYRANQDLISVGAYRSGADPKIDRAIASRETINQFIRQPLFDHCLLTTVSESYQRLRRTCSSHKLSSLR